MKLKLICAAAAVSLSISMPASAVVTVFTTTLTSIGEPVPTSSATGSAIVTFDSASDSIIVQLSFAGLANTNPFGHIHCCTALAGSGSGPVALNFTGLPAVSSGSYASSFTPGVSAFDTILAGASAGKAYVNIHTPGTYAGGEIRGFLAISPVPEPGSVAMLLAGLGVVSFVARRRSV